MTGKKNRGDGGLPPRSHLGHARSPSRLKQQGVAAKKRIRKNLPSGTPKPRRHVGLLQKIIFC
jgi:hypothetical protein